LHVGKLDKALDEAAGRSSTCGGIGRWSIPSRRTTPRSN